MYLQQELLLFAFVSAKLALRITIANSREKHTRYLHCEKSLIRLRFPFLSSRDEHSADAYLNW